MKLSLFYFKLFVQCTTLPICPQNYAKLITIKGLQKLKLSFIVNLQIIIVFLAVFVLFSFNDNNFIMPCRLIRRGRGHSDETVLIYQKGKN